jgi:hypothetical protein
MSDTWPKHLELILTQQHVDYINEALDMLANYHDIELADDIGERIISAWNCGELLTPARKTMFDALWAKRKHRNSK